MDNKLTSSSTYVAELTRVLQQFDSEAAEQIVEVLFEAFESDAGVFIFGNGGSAALASHFACDLAKTATLDASRRLRVLSLTDNVPLMSAWSNDAGYEHVFAEQLRNFVSEGDVAIGISCSGNSANVIRGLELARRSGARTVGITGNGGRMKPLCDICMSIPSNNVQIIEDLHVVTMHSVATVLSNRIMASRGRFGIHKLARVG